MPKIIFLSYIIFWIRWKELVKWPFSSRIVISLKRTWFKTFYSIFKIVMNNGSKVFELGQKVWKGLWVQITAWGEIKKNEILFCYSNDEKFIRNPNAA